MRRVRAIAGLRVPLALLALVGALLLVSTDRPTGPSAGSGDHRVAVASAVAIHASFADPRPTDRVPVTAAAVFVLLAAAGLSLSRCTFPRRAACAIPPGRPVRAPPAFPAICASRT